MAELIPAPFDDLVTRLFREPELQGTVFELPRGKWYVPPADGPDLAVRFHGQLAGNPVGPAAGPHTQMAQNILLSYIAGGRILELKTVQVDDRLTIPRPCIDMTNIGYNIEWSQELRIEDSLREYVAGAMLVEMFRHACDYNREQFTSPASEVIYDISVGYDLAGIRSDEVRSFLDGMRDAGPVVDRLRAEIPSAYAEARDLPYPTMISSSVTLSTFHGCPADEIERICEFLIGEHDFDVIVKMNPPMLGRERLEHLLHEVLGYSELRVNPTAYTSGLTFEEAVQLCARLTAFADQRGRRLGFKFSNTLEVLNHREFFTPESEIMYLSGQPLHVITMTLTDEFRRAVGPDVPISFSAGIDQHNFPMAVACGFVPITISTDLLRPGGYGRLPKYLKGLAAEMSAVGAENVEQFIRKRFAGVPLAARLPVHEAHDEATLADKPPVAPQHLDVAPRHAEAALRNTTIAARQTREDPRYRAERNRAIPKRIDSQLETFDCITCDKCLPVCPNAANFVYPTPIVGFDYHDLIVLPDGSVREGQKKRFEITEDMQIACYADFCNECGNCDTFCPEYGGPYIKKPSFFGTRESWERAAPRDGFYVLQEDGRRTITGRMHGRTSSLSCERSGEPCDYDDGMVRVRFSAEHEVDSVQPIQPLAGEHAIDMAAYHTLRHLLEGVLDRRRLNQVNASHE